MTMVQTTLRSAYLAGPMRGIEDYNFPAFRQATALLRQTGWEIFSPAERDEQDPDIDHEANVAGWTGERGLDYFMAHDLKAVCEMDCVICLPGWEQSQGARLETVTAVEIGHPVFELVDVMDGPFLIDRRLAAVNPDYIQEAFASRGMIEDADAKPEDFEGYVVQDVLDFIDGVRQADLDAHAAEIGWDGATTHEERVAEDRAAMGIGPEPVARVESALPIGSEARKAVPLAVGVLDYFPAALAEVARVSKAGNDKHNPGQPMHHARGKSTDHADCLIRHLVDRGKVDPETGQRHSAQVAWRALALLQQELEDDGEAPLPRGARA